MSQRLKELVLFWNEKAAGSENALGIFNAHTNPFEDARRLAVIQIAIHDTINYFENRFDPFVTGLKKELSEGHKGKDAEGHESDGQVGRIGGKLGNGPARLRGQQVEEAVNSAAYEAMVWAVEELRRYKLEAMQGTNKSFDPTNPVFAGMIAGLESVSLGLKNDCKAWMDQWYTANGVSRHQPTIDIGKKIAGRITQARDSDGSRSLVFLSPFPPELTNGQPGLFRADYYKFPNQDTELKLLLVGYGAVNPFVLSKSNYFSQPLDEGSYSAAARQDDVLEVQEKGTVAFPMESGLEARMDFWSLEMHVRWNLFTRALVKTPSVDGCEAARILALVHTAMADGAIAVFRDMYRYMHWRPVTAINASFNNEQPWVARFDTPRVPEYPSAFSILGGAVGEILESVFPVGLQGPVTVNSNGRAITYTSISEAVNDCALTKIYRGWNFRTTASMSIIQGRQIGKYVLGHAFKPVSHVKIPDRQPVPKPDVVFKDRERRV